MNISTSFWAAGFSAFAPQYWRGQTICPPPVERTLKKSELRGRWRSSIAIFFVEELLFVPECDPALGRVVRRHFDVDFIAWNDANSIFPHLTFRPCDNFVLVFKFDTVHCIRQQFENRTGKLKQFFLSHILSLVVNSAGVVPVTAGNVKF
jgi:hypothetical protein